MLSRFGRTKSRFEAAHVAVTDGASGTSGRVSVIIANYNYASFVGAAIDSALALDWPDVEVIVVDDGSTDSSRQVIASYGSRIQVILQDNMSQRVARNTGFAASTGSWIVHLDSDDVLDRQLVREASRVWGPSVSKVQVQMYRIDAIGSRFGKPFPEYRRVPDPSQLRFWAGWTSSYPTPPGSGNIYARWFLDILFPLDDFCGSATDSACLAAAPFLGNVAVVPRALVGYRIHGANESEMSNRPEKFSAAIQRAVRRHVYATQFYGAGYRADRDANMSALRRSRPLLQLRVASCRVAPTLPTLPGDSLIRMACDAIRSPVHPGPEPFRVRLTILAWTLVTLGAPLPVAQALISHRFAYGRSPHRRKPMLRNDGRSRLLGGRGPELG